MYRKISEYQIVIVWTSSKAFLLNSSDIELYRDITKSKFNDHHICTSEEKENERLLLGWYSLYDLNS